TPYPDLENAIVAQLKAIHTFGGCVQQPIAGAVIWSHISHSAPHLLEKGFKISDLWVHKFLSGTLNWTMRKATRATQKVPEN
ncbi:hypothetical protein JAAARDRAFT_110995, partial [Jaapia argillacea MUCL 33604]